MSEVLEPLAPKFGDTPSIPIGCNRLQSVATDREVWCGNGISQYVIVSPEEGETIIVGLGGSVGSFGSSTSSRAINIALLVSPLSMERVLERFRRRLYLRVFRRRQNMLPDALIVCLPS